jgi:quinol monooxygenase YgiN
MMAIAKSIDFSGWSGLRLLTVTRVAEDTVLVTAGYENKAAADANVENAKASLGKMAEFMTEEPFVREGEVVWGVDGDQSLTPGYVRHVFVDFDPAKYDAMISYFDTTTERSRGVAGLIRVRLSRILENRMVTVGVYDNKASAVAGQENMRAIMAGIAEFVTGDYNIREGEVGLHHDYR